jgi:hypothetical protein
MVSVPGPIHKPAERIAWPRYNSPLSQIRRTAAMEAERINAISNHIADLVSRGDQLRRYL